MHVCTPCLLQFTQLPQLIPNRCISGEAEKNMPLFNSFTAEFQLRQHSCLPPPCPPPWWPRLLSGDSLPSPHTCLVWGNICRGKDSSGPALPLSRDQPLWARVPRARQGQHRARLPCTSLIQVLGPRSAPEPGERSSSLSGSPSCPLPGSAAAEQCGDRHLAAPAVPH